ncbi:MAG TPA: sigma-54 dependent transcriptional regulator [Pyrinomonadaceae bacterium]|nr:sigma-54 dependent transcriptional regulator [Pyrinomonadaceae bacterium]
MPDILLVEDKDSLRRVLRLTLEAAGYTVAECADARSAAQEIARAPFRLVLTDLRMPHGSGLDVLRAARAADPEAPVVVMTAYGSIDEAVQAMKEGAHDFLQKPVDSNHLLLLVGRALEQARLRTENILLREEWSRRYGFPRIIGESDAIKRAVSEVQRVATTDATVLLLGESGTGKELFARAVHHLSPRRDKPFVAVNCAAIPESLIESELFGHEKGSFTGATERRPGKFELASGGTVFLDEIGELPPPAQGKLLRAIEEKTVDRVGGRAPVPVDIRVVAATTCCCSRATSPHSSARNCAGAKPRSARRPRRRSSRTLGPATSASLRTPSSAPASSPTRSRSKRATWVCRNAARAPKTKMLRRPS